MGEPSYLVEGVSGTGETSVCHASVCHALRARGHHGVDGDRELADQGDPVTGDPTDTASHWHHLRWAERVAGWWPTGHVGPRP